MKKIGQQLASQAFMQSRPTEGSDRSKGKSNASQSKASSKSSKSEESEESSSTGGAESMDGLPNVGMSAFGPIEAVDRYMGGSGGNSEYTDEAVDQHNELGTKAARGELLSQSAQVPHQTNLSRKVGSTSIARTSATQSTQRVSAASRQRSGLSGGLSNQQTSLRSQQAASVQKTQKQNPLDDDLPRVGLHD